MTTPPDPRPWRVGAHWGTTIIAEGSGLPDHDGRREGDELIGVMFRPELAREVVELRGRLHAAHDALTRITDADDDVFTTLEYTVEYVVGSYRRIAESEAAAADEVERLRARLREESRAAERVAEEIAAKITSRVDELGNPELLDRDAANAYADAADIAREHARPAAGSVAEERDRAEDVLPRLNQPMLERLRGCAADSSPSWSGAITIYPPGTDQPREADHA